MSVEPVQPTPAVAPPTRLSVTHEGRLLLGAGPAGALITGVNLSASTDDISQPLGMVSGTGQFMAALPFGAQPGDYMELTFTTPSSTSSIIIQLGGADDRAPPIQPLGETVRLDARPRNRLQLKPLAPSLRLSEPHATLTLSNWSTGGKVDVQLDSRGRLPRYVELPGHKDDQFSVSVRDNHGKQSHDQILVAGATPGTEPMDVSHALMDGDRHGRSRYATTRLDQPLFDADMPIYRQVRQQVLGSCFVIAPIIATAAQRPDHIRQMFTKRGRDYVVRLYERDGRPRPVPVSTRLFVTSTGDLRYATGSLGGALLEKALSPNGSYASIEKGGHAHIVLGQLMGLPPDYAPLSQRSETWLWERLQLARRRRLPSCLGTNSALSKEMAEHGLLGGHEYAVLDMAIVNGVRQVKLFEPNGKTEPMNGDKAADGVLDGEFWLPLSDVCKFFIAYHGVLGTKELPSSRLITVRRPGAGSNKVP